MIITIKDLQKKYKDVIAVDNVTLEIEEGEIFGLLGPNGAGKTTTIRSMLGLIDIDNGEINIFGKKFNNDVIETKKRMGYVPQDLAFYEELNAIDNVRYWGKIYGLSGDELNKAVEEALNATGLWDRRKGKSKTFSGGMKRRLNIACAIVHKPEILIMDEPTVGVDPQSRNSILECIRELNKKGATIIYTSHYMEEIEAICNRVAILDNGKVVCCGKLNEVIDEHCSEHILVIPTADLGEENIKKLEADDMVESVTVSGDYTNILYADYNDVVSIIEKLKKLNVDLKDMTIKRQNLETLFLKLTGKTLRD